MTLTGEQLFMLKLFYLTQEDILMHDVKVLANVYTRNKMVLARQLEGLSHADSLIQPETRGNCLNFVLGHIVVYRDFVMEMLGLAPLMDPAERSRYGTDVDPITEDDEDVVPLERLITLLDQSNELLIEAIEGLSAEGLEREVQLGSSTATLGQRLEFFGWHEAYHVGQTEFLRQLAGTDDKVI